MHAARVNLRKASYVLLLGAAVLAPRAAAQSSAAEDSVRAIARIDELLVRQADLFERELWPDYRFDSLGLMYILPRVGKLAVRWPGVPPRGMRPLAGFKRAWWADTQAVNWPGGLPIGIGSVNGTRGQLMALALHEAFHAHEKKLARAGRRFGAGENSLLTSQYPVFDVENEARFAVESRLLARALRARSLAEKRRLAAEFLAIRRERHARLDPRFVEYERLSEQHEGLAQYVYHRGLALLTERDPSLTTDMRAELAAEGDVLGSTLRAGSLSVRRRFYATGSHMGLLLDQLSTPAWKLRLVEHDIWLQDILADVVGVRALSAATIAELDAAFRGAVQASAARAARRLEQRDSVLAIPGTRITVDVPNANVQLCSFDPQNLLITDSGQQLHMRTVSLCVSGRTVARLNVPVVQDDFTGTAHFVSRAPPALTAGDSAVQLPAAGESIVLDSVALRADGVSVTAARAILIGARGGLRVLVLSP